MSTCLAIMLAVVTNAAAAAPSTLVAVAAVKAIGDVPPRVQVAFERSLLTEVRKVEGVAAIGAGEIADMLSSEAQGRMRGCTQDEGCLLEVAPALSVGEILTTEIVARGDEYAATLRRLGVADGKVLETFSRTVPKGSGEALLGLIGPAVEALYPGRALKAGHQRGVAPDVAKRLNPPPLPRWVFAATAAGAGVALIAGGIFTLRANDSTNAYNDLVKQSTQQPVPGAQLNALKDELDTNKQLATGFLIAGGVLTAAAVVEAFFTDWHDYRSQIAVLPAPGGAMLALGGTF